MQVVNLHLLASCECTGKLKAVKVVIGVVIRSVERYDVMKTKPTKSEAEHWFCL